MTPFLLLLGKWIVWRYLHSNWMGDSATRLVVLQSVGHHVVDEAAGLLNVVEGVLAERLLLGAARLEGNHDHRRVVAQVVELAERGEVVHAVGADGGYPGDGTGAYAGLEGVGFEAVVVELGVIMHGSISFFIFIARVLPLSRVRSASRWAD